MSDEATHTEANANSGIGGSKPNELVLPLPSKEARMNFVLHLFNGSFICLLLAFNCFVFRNSLRHSR